MANFDNLALINLHALPADANEPHIQPGNHVRINHHPLLGLPVAPFILQRALLSSRRTLAMRHEAVFVTASGPQSLPVQVTPDRPVTIYLGGPGRTCIWANVKVTPAATVPEKPITRLGTDIQLNPDIRRSIGSLAGHIPLPALGGLGLGGRGGKAGLSVEAYVASVAQGPVFVGRRSAAPYSLSAPGIVQLIVKGTGTITGIDWIAGEDAQDLTWKTVGVLNLPHPGGRRYMAITNASGLCKDRVASQAPKRRPLYDTTGAPAPVAAPAHTATDEVDRVNTLSSPMLADLDALVNDPQSQLEQTVSLTVTDAAGNRVVSDAGDVCSMDYPRLPRFFLGLADPGAASFFGYKDCDKDVDNLEDSLVFYRVQGWFRDDPAAGKLDPALAQIISTVPLSERSYDSMHVEREMAERLAAWLKERGQRVSIDKLEQANNYMQLTAVAVADHQAPLDGVDPPKVQAGQHMAWLPQPAGVTRREVELPISGVMVGATLAEGRVQPEPGGAYAVLNPEVGHGWHVPLTLGLRQTDGAQPPLDILGRGTLFDRTAGPEAARYFVAQADRFGRWSAFAANIAAAGPRPKPPRPVLSATYTQPAIADAALHGGRVEALVALPEADMLAPGSFPLARVRLSASHVAETAGASATVMAPIEVDIVNAISVEPVSPRPDGEPDRRAVPVRFEGPILQPMEVRRLILSAVWIDTAGQLSVPSEEVRLRMTDPRPPAHMPIPETLLYSSRPDATGLAWVERSWPAASSARYAVYYTDETRLLAYLVEKNQTTLVDQLRGNSDRAFRAGQYRLHQTEFPDRLFERLDGVVMDLGGGKMGFRHAVSGASRILNAYKVVPESPINGARPAISDADMVFYGVPNSDPPPRPMVSVKQVAPEAGEPALVVEVTVRLPKGVTVGQVCRIYRTRMGVADPLRIPVVVQLPFGAADENTGEQRVVFRDSGAAQIAPGAQFTPFTRYTWIADAQGAPESGSSVAGLWGRASDPISIPVVPATSPEPPVFNGFDGTTVAEGVRDVKVNFTSTEGALPPSAMGPYRLRLERAVPGAMMDIVFDGEIGGMPLSLATGDSGEVTPVGTRFRATLTDPLGRSSTSITMTLS